MELAATTRPTDDVDQARAGLYALLAQLLAKPPTTALLADVAGLCGPGTALGQALSALAQEAAQASAAEVEREYNKLFIGVERGELVPYASFYLTGFINDRPLARLRHDMQALGIERQPGIAEPEDHIATVCEIMAGLITRALGPVAELDEQHFFERHLAPWAGRFFKDLEAARAARFYRPAGTVGRLFLEIEAQAWAMTAPPEADPVRSAAVQEEHRLGCER